MNGFFVAAPEVLIARRIESTGHPAPALEIIRWRIEQLRAETIIEADFWGVLPCDVALTRAVRLAKARGVTRRGCTEVDSASPRNSAAEDRIAPSGESVRSK